MEININSCPEFPFFGAKYPDATCIDGYLWDSDSYEDELGFTSGGDIPCPFCQSEKHKEYFDITQEEIDNLHKKYYI